MNSIYFLGKDVRKIKGSCWVAASLQYNLVNQYFQLILLTVRCAEICIQNCNESSRILFAIICQEKTFTALVHRIIYHLIETSQRVVLYMNRIFENKFHSVSFVHIF